MSRFTSFFKQIAHGFSLTLLCVISLGILLMVGIIKVVDTLWRLLVLPGKKRHIVTPVPNDPLSEEFERSVLALLNTGIAAQGFPLTLPSSTQGMEPRYSEDLKAAIERYQSMPPSYDDFDDELYDEDGFLAEPEVAKPVITIEILRRDEAPEPNMPSTFFPGCGSDGARFQVIGDDKPNDSDLCTALYRWADDACLVNYDQETGIGYFRIVDGEAPETGSVIDLE